MPEMKFLDLKILSSSSLDVFAPIVMEFETPPDTLVVSRFRLEQKEDTIWKPAKTGISLQRLDSLNPRKFSITYPWEYGHWLPSAHRLHRRHGNVRTLHQAYGL